MQPVQRSEILDLSAYEAVRDRVRADVLALLEELGPSDTARALGVSRATMHAWRERGGWLAPTTPRR